MGSHSKQGWYLFLFLIGFTFLVAGLAYIGFVFTVAGLICLIASLIGFFQIKGMENGVEQEQPAPSPQAKVRAS